MPDMIPVATEINPPNLNAFANLVNLKQSAATANQAAQQNQELVALGQFTKQAMQDPSYRNQDGFLNVGKFQADASKVAPVYGQAYIGQITANANEGIANKKALLDLSNDQRKTAGNYFASVAANPYASKSDLLDAVDEARGVSDDPAYQRSIDSFLLHAPQVEGMDPAKASQAYRQYARNAALAVQAPGASESAPQMGTVQAPGGIQPVNTNPQSPLGVGTVGQPIKQGIAPQIVTQPGTGAPNVVGPGGQASPITPAPQPGQPQRPQGQNWWNPAPWQLNFLTAQTQGVAQRAQVGIAAAQNSPMAIDALDRSQAILDKGVPTGTLFAGFKELKNVATSLGIDWNGAANANELAKNIARAEAARANSVGDTDAARSLTELGGPNTKIDNAALKSILQQSRAVESMTLGYAKLMETSPDPLTAMQRETAFRSVPHLVQAYEASGMKSKADMDAFLKRYNISPAELAKSRQQLRDMGAL